MWKTTNIVPTVILPSITFTFIYSKIFIYFLLVTNILKNKLSLENNSPIPFPVIAISEAISKAHRMNKYCWAMTSFLGALKQQMLFHRSGCYNSQTGVLPCSTPLETCRMLPSLLYFKLMLVCGKCWSFLF